GAGVLAADPDGFLVNVSQTSVMRVDNSGAITFTTTVPRTFYRAADFDGDRYAVVWAETDFTHATMLLRALSIGFDGGTGQPATIASLPAPIDERLGIAYNAGRHLVAFTETEPYFGQIIPGTVGPSHIDGLRIDRALQPLDPAPFVIDHTPWADIQPLVAARGSGF